MYLSQYVFMLNKIMSESESESEFTTFDDQGLSQYKDVVLPV